METIRGKISYKTKNLKAIKLEGDERYLNAYKKEDLDPYSVGQTVEISYNVKGTFNNISKITLISEQVAPKVETPKTTPPPVTTGYVCAECNKPLKDGKFKKCYDCNQKTKDQSKTEDKSEPVKGLPQPLSEEEIKKDKSTPEVYLCNTCGAKMKTNKYPTCYNCNKKNPTKTEKSTSYNNPERDAQIRRGNAINASAAAISGNMVGSDPETLKQALLYIAEGALTWLEEKNRN
jgi:hypothetical protein